MSYKINDVYEYVLRKFSDIFDNHLFLIFFFFFIVFFGSFGIWAEPVILSDNINWEKIPDKFNTLALISISAPLLSVAIFDSVVSFVSKAQQNSENIDWPLIVWLSVLSIIYIVAIGLLFLFGAKEKGYTVYSAVAWGMVLLYWAMANIDNPSYKNTGKSNSPTGTDEYDNLSRG